MITGSPGGDDQIMRTARSLLASAMLLAISVVTRLLEFWFLQGVGGVS